MQQTDIDALSDIKLAVAVAHNIMDWDTASRSGADNPMMEVYHDGKWHEWQPWRDMRAAWEIVEKMVADGWKIEMLRDNDWSCSFWRMLPFRDMVAHADTPGVAIMRAALAAVRSAG